MYLHKSPQILKKTITDAYWEIDTKEEEIYLTFDDGPHPEVTPQVLDILKTYDAKATFFCVGKNIVENSDVYQRIIADGHQVGNHTYSHNNGWKNSNYRYLKSYLKCQNIVGTNLFRPPYGRISPKQYQLIKKRSKIIMWTVLSGDFDNTKSIKQCVSNVLTGIKKGSIVVFHDSAKAKDRVLGCLPIVLKELTSKGYIFKSL